MGNLPCYYFNASDTCFFYVGDENGGPIKEKKKKSTNRPC